MRELSSIYEIHSMNDPNLPIILHLDTVRCSSREQDFRNWHENLELLAVVRGRGSVRIDSRVIEAEVGDVICVNCNTLHNAVTDSELEYYCVIIDREYCLENGIDVLKMPLSERIIDPELYSGILTLAALTESYRQGDTEPHTVLAIRHAILGVLLSAFRSHRAEKVEGGELSAATGMVKEVLRYLSGNMTSEIRLDDIAAFVNASKYHVARQFRAVMGSTIFDYFNMLKCREARRLLSSGYTVSEAASAAGYSNLSYFTKCFKRYEGVLPSTYSKGKKRGQTV